MTAQITDTILYLGSELPIHSEPLKNYLQTAELPHQLVAPHTGCWRGYFAKWAIDNKKLFLIEWKGFILNYQEVGIEYLFPGEEFVFADWFSGTIKIPQEEPLV